MFEWGRRKHKTRVMPSFLGTVSVAFLQKSRNALRLQQNGPLRADEGLTHFDFFIVLGGSQ